MLQYLRYSPSHLAIQIAARQQLCTHPKKIGLARSGAVSFECPDCGKVL